MPPAPGSRRGQRRPPRARAAASRDPAPRTMATRCSRAASWRALERSGRRAESPRYQMRGQRPAPRHERDHTQAPRRARDGLRAERAGEGGGGDRAARASAPPLAPPSGVARGRWLRARSAERGVGEGAGGRRGERRGADLRVRARARVGTGTIEACTLDAGFATRGPRRIRVRPGWATQALPAPARGAGREPWTRSRGRLGGTSRRSSCRATLPRSERRVQRRPIRAAIAARGRAAAARSPPGRADRGHRRAVPPPSPPRLLFPLTRPLCSPRADRGVVAAPG